MECVRCVSVVRVLCVYVSVYCVGMCEYNVCVCVVRVLCVRCPCSVCVSLFGCMFFPSIFPHIFLLITPTPCNLPLLPPRPPDLP